MTKFKENWLFLWVGIRWPYTQKTAWTCVLSWVGATAFVLLSIVADFIVGRYAWLPMVLAVGAFDIVMLYRSVRGLLWRRNIDKTLTGTRFMS